MLFTMNPDGEIDGYVEQVERGPYPRVRSVKLDKPIPMNESERNAQMVVRDSEPDQPNGK